MNLKKWIMNFFCDAFENNDILSPDEYKFYKSKVQKEKLKYKNELKKDLKIY